MRVAIYIRMSTEDQADSPERQKHQINLYCQKKNYTIVAEYADLGMRGYDDNRPDFIRLLNDAQQKKFEVIVVDEPSRLSRNDPLDFFVKVAHPLRSTGIILDSVSKGVCDWNDLGGLIIQTVSQYNSSAETVNLSRRVSTGMVQYFLRGNYYGRVPFGYRLVMKDGLRKLEINPEEEGIVREIFRLYLEERLSMVSVLNRIFHLLKPIQQKKWSSATIYHILTCPAYIGDSVMNRKTYSRFHRITKKGVLANEKVMAKRIIRKNSEDEWIVLRDTHPAYISREQQEEIKQIRQRNKQERNYGRTVFFRRFVYCPLCGYAFSTTAARKISGDNYYCLRANSGPLHCQNKITLSDRNLLILIRHILKNLLANQLHQDRLRQELADQFSLQGKPNEEEDIRAKMGELAKKIKQANKNILFMDDESADEARKEIGKLVEQKNLLQSKLDVLAARVESPSKLESILERAVAVADLIPSQPRHLNEQIVKIIRSIFVRCEVLNGRTDKKYFQDRCSSIKFYLSNGQEIEFKQPEIRQIVGPVSGRKGIVQD